MLIPQRRRAQPATGVDIDRGHWFAKGAALILPFHRSANSGTAASVAFALSGASLQRHGGLGGKHLHISAAGDVLNLGAHAALQINSFTILAVVQLTTIAADTTISQSNYSGGGSFAGAQFRVGSTGRVELLRDSSAQIFQGNTALTTTKMHAIALSYDSASGVCLCAVDGANHGTATDVRTFSHASFALGRKQGSDTSESQPHRNFLYGLHPHVFTLKELLDLSSNPWQVLRPAQRRFFASAATGGAITVAVNQVTETDTAQAVSRIKARALGQCAETDTAQAVSRIKRKTLGQTTESDTAQAVSRTKARALGQVSETDLAQSLARLKARAIAQVTETDLAQAFARSKVRALLQAVETDSAQAVAWAPKIRVLGQALELDVALPVSGGIVGEVVRISDMDFALAQREAAFAVARRTMTPALAQRAAGFTLDT